MTRVPPIEDLTRVRAQVEELAGHALQLTDRIATAVATALATRATPRRADLHAVEPLVVPALADGDNPVQGAGFVAAIGLLDDAPWWLEWFARDPDGRPQRLITHSEPHGIGFYDYEHLPWYVVPRDTGRSHMTGPYVDYLCTEEYTLTFTTPVVVDGNFRGVAGADVAVKRVEQALLPALRASGARLAVVNSFGRILSSNSGRHLCGDLLEGFDLADVEDVQRVGDLPLAVVALD